MAYHKIKSNPKRKSAGMRGRTAVPNPRRRKRKHSNPMHSAAHANPKGKRKHRHKLTGWTAYANPRKRRRVRRNPARAAGGASGITAVNKPVEMVLTVGAGAAVALVAAAVGKAVAKKYAPTMVDTDAKAGLAGNVAAVGVGLAAAHFGKKNKMIRTGGIACAIAGVVYAVKDLAGAKIEESVAKALPGTGGYMAMPGGVNGYVALRPSSLAAFAHEDSMGGQFMDISGRGASYEPGWHGY